MIDLESHIPVSLNIQRKLKTYTLAEYLRKEAKSEDKHEFINGHIIKLPFSSGNRNIISANITAVLSFSLKSLEENYIVHASNQKIYCPALNDCVYANTSAVCEKPIYWDDEKLLLINPIIVVEVLSKSTQKYDRTSKFDKYKTLESFKEYVLIRQDTYYAEVWYREKPDTWKETIVTDLSQKLPLQSVGVEIPMQRIYKNIEL